MLTRTARNQVDGKQWLEGRSWKYRFFDITPAMQNIAFIITDHRAARMPAFHNIITGNFNEKMIGHLNGNL
jgi:hypothetical protein